ncbi:MAG: serine/threonine protein kinase [Alphaproteobacteria bacterium]|nr:serine/threonine protein kinase [Alphaproteobacteria bacterium]
MPKKDAPEAAEDAPETEFLTLGGKEHDTGIPIPVRPAPAAFDPDDHPPVTVNERYMVYPSQPLHDLSSPSAQAYAAEDKREPGRQLYALVCNPGLPVRTGVMQDMKRKAINGLIPLVDFGSEYWSPFDHTCMFVIFERPLGGRLTEAFGDKPLKVNEYELAKVILEPLAHAIAEMATADIQHRAIRLDNIFFMDRERHILVLGECVTSPPGFDQPSIYEPLERGLAMACGRGKGETRDDLYALGICALFLLLGYNPLGELSDEQMLIAKIEQGTYQAFCANERIPMALIEPLRGLMSDDPLERWPMEALELWISGQKKTPIQRRPIAKPKSTYGFGGYKHKSPRTIALFFAKNVNDAARAVKNGKLEHWVRQSLGDTHLADDINSLALHAKVHEGSPDASDEVLVAKTIMRLDPEGPLRYKGFSCTPDGFGAAMAVEYMRKESFQIPGEIFARDLMGYWFSSQREPNKDYIIIEKTFQNLRALTKINEMGYGLERCLYELNPSLPCLSPLLRSVYVEYVEEMLEALDQVADSVDSRTRPMDKHIAAFIATYFRHDITPHLKAVSDAKDEVSLIGTLSLLALMQWRQQTEPLLGLASWIGGLLGPAINTYHSRKTRRSLEEKIPALVRQGSLPGLFDLIDNGERRMLDNTEFDDARIRFAQAEDEIQTLIGDDVDQEKQALQKGEKATAMIALTVSMVATSVILTVMSM